ncbi:hypothetical protein [Alicyclobacillus dauci]|uniref:Uncharacterized protein n=1 Tax=Alicyclobacillus dauci TaxID=1475485 RepID=A0ABY6YWZ7_9BACL|nr:hypothetical protein [Alicyclobacillus dauci]WAH35012.1 hypothetical protein NZD86_11795 [Alicyclobacillus dauci]
MGLDFSHCDAHWAYSGFMRFRRRLAEQIGFALDEMEGFGGTRSFDEMVDDIKPLLDHSDCDGELTPEECKQVAPRLRELVSGWLDDDRDKIQALDLAEGMELAAEEGEPLRFR